LNRGCGLEQGARAALSKRHGTCLVPVFVTNGEPAVHPLPLVLVADPGSSSGRLRAVSLFGRQFFGQHLVGEGTEQLAALDPMAAEALPPGPQGAEHAHLLGRFLYQQVFPAPQPCE